jgi:LTXXQ motif family protein
MQLFQVMAIHNLWLDNLCRRFLMLKTTLAAGFTALLVSASSLAYAQAPSTGGIERLSAADVGTLTDARVNIVKAALQLTPDQEKHWPAIEDAIRTRAKDRQSRLAAAATRLGEQREGNAIEVLRDRNPVEFVQRRAAALAQRAADLKKLADAWAPLYPTLSPDQKRRMAALTIFVLREMRNGLEQRRLQSEDDEG